MGFFVYSPPRWLMDGMKHLGMFSESSIYKTANKMSGISGEAGGFSIGKWELRYLDSVHNMTSAYLPVK